MDSSTSIETRLFLYWTRMISPALSLNLVKAGRIYRSKTLPDSAMRKQCGRKRQEHKGNN